MLTRHSSVRINISTQPADMHKSFDGLSALVAGTVGLDPMSGHRFVFSHASFHSCMKFSSSTLTNWVEAGVDLLSVVYDAWVREAMNGNVLGTDDRGLKVLDRDHENGIKQGSMGVYGADDRVVVFDDTSDHKAFRGGATPVFSVCPASVGTRSFPGLPALP